MLSRVANSLFWLARYVERADNTARFLAVTSSYAQELQGLSRAAAQACWDAARELFTPERERDAEASSSSFREFIFDPEVPNSVLCSIALARENARSIRDAIASEMWEELNVLYLRLRDEADSPISETRQQALLRQVRDTSHLLQGLCDNTMVRADEWHFLRLGWFLERADNTLRSIDMMFSHRALQAAADSGHNIDALHLAAALRICTAVEAFARTAPLLTSESVIGFLLLDGCFPRSVEFCLQELEQSLHVLSRTPAGVYTNEAEQLCGRLVAELRFASVEEIMLQGLHETLLRVLHGVGEIGGAIYQEYFV